MYDLKYLNEDEYKKKERSLKKYYMIAYKKLIFDFYPALRKGDFKGEIVSNNTKDMITKYELKLPTDRLSAKVHGDVALHYTVYENRKVVMLDTITPEDILSIDNQSELKLYKGVVLSKTHSERDMFRINLLNTLGNRDYIPKANNYSEKSTINNLEKKSNDETVYENGKVVMLDTITPEDILTEEHQKELTSYKGVPVSMYETEPVYNVNLMDSSNPITISMTPKLNSQFESRKRVKDNNKNERKKDKKNDIVVVFVILVLISLCIFLFSYLYFKSDTNTIIK